MHTSELTAFQSFLTVARRAEEYETSHAPIIKELTDTWDTIQEQARTMFPHATEEEVYQISKAVMNKAIQL